MRLNPERSDKNSKTGRTKLNVYSGERHFTTTSEIVEKPGGLVVPHLWGIDYGCQSPASGNA